MFSTGPNYNKLKTNLRLAVSRLKLMEKKKTELAQKARREIADYISNGKYDRAKIRVEHIIREDYLVEAMEIVEMYCDLLLARFGLIQQMKALDDGLAEAISSVIWVTPRLQADVAELKAISDILTVKYGKPYAQAARENALKSVNEKLMHKLSVQAPPKILVEKYLIEIAKSHGVPYEPDQDVMRDEENGMFYPETAENALIDFGADDGDKWGPGGGMPIPQQVTFPAVPVSQPFTYPNVAPSQPFNYPAPGFNVPSPYEKPPLPSNPPSAPPAINPGPIGFSPPNIEESLPPYESVASGGMSKEFPDGGLKPVPAPRKTGFVDTLPDLPAVPTTSIPNLDNSTAANDTMDDVDFDDLTKRFEDLKKRK